MRQVIGSTHRREGRREDRLFQIIQCQECGAITYERRKTRVQEALDRDCQACKGISSNKAQKRLQAEYRQDGRCKHPLYITYQGMITRCYDPNHKSYIDYGRRGIEVCVRWIVDFWAFVEDVGERPVGTTMDRIDNDGHYCPGNCKWSTQKEQIANRRKRFTLLTDDEYKLQEQAKRVIHNRKHYKPADKSWWV